MEQATQVPTSAEGLLAAMECLADATRLRLLRLLERNELGVTELCDTLQLPQSTVSRHLKVLGDQGWVRSRRHGTNNLYRMVLDELEPAARKLWVVAREQTSAWSTAVQDDTRLRRLLQEKETDSQAFFAGAAAKWDRLRDEYYGRSFSATAMLSLVPSHWVVADLACGTGQATAEIARCVKRVIAVDNSTQMLKAARRRVGELTNVDLRRGDLESLPIESESCDAVLLLLALTYVADPGAVVKEMGRVLKAGGRAIVVDLLPHDREDFRVEMGQTRRGIAAADVRGMLLTADFVSDDVRELPPEPAAKGPALFLASASRVARSLVEAP